MSRKVFIGMPVGTGDVRISTVISMISSMVEINAEGWQFPQYHFRVGDSDLCNARNAIIGRFMAGDYTDMVLIDSDISWNTGDLTRLINHDKDFVAGIYRGRSDDKLIYNVHWPEKREMWTDPKTGFPLLKVDSVTIGFCRLTRACVEKLVASLNGEYMVDETFEGETYPWLVDFEHKNRARWDEGYSLCRRWRELGGDVWIDPMINLGHMGPKVFEGNFMGALEEMQSMARFRPIPMAG